MADIREVVQSKLTRRQGLGDAQKSSADDVDILTKHMRAVSDVKDVADALSGGKGLRDELSDKERKIEALEKEKTEITLTSMKEGLESKIADLKKSYIEAIEHKDEPKVKELERELREQRDLLHKAEIDSLRHEIAEAKGSKERKSLAEQIKEIKETSSELGLGPVERSSGTPPDLLIELKKMDQNLQVKLEEMKDDRERRDKEWQLTVKKWDEERELRREEAKGKYAAEQERTTLIKSAIDRGARIMGRAVMEEEPAQPGGGPISYRVEADEGEMGDFTCPKCSSTVAIAPDTVAATCAKCGFRAQIERKAKPAGAPSEPQG